MKRRDFLTLALIWALFVCAWYAGSSWSPA
jgi:hypothetical protein